MRGLLRAAIWLTLAAPLATFAADAPEFAQRFARAAAGSGDNRAAPFVVVDKRSARLFLFEGDGRLRAASTVLLGAARGDMSVPGIGIRQMKDIRPDERTTPAGRFVTEPGVNTGGEDIVWLDYDAAVSMHRVRATNRSERRLERLASPRAGDHRISYGCINIPTRFYDEQVRPLLGHGPGLVYVLPESAPAERWFPFLKYPAAP